MSVPSIKTLQYYDFHECCLYLEAHLFGLSIRLKDYVQQRFNPNQSKEIYQVDLSDVSGDEIFYGLEYLQYPLTTAYCPTLNQDLALFRSTFGITGAFFTNIPNFNVPPDPPSGL